MRIDIVSLFPEYFRGPFDESMIARARQKELIDLNLVDLRLYGMGNYRQVDDRVYGGGPGMVLMAQPVAQALREAKAKTQGRRQRTLFMSPQGTPLTAAKCRELAEWDHLIVLCGHYEGVDQRVLDKEVDEEISIGDYVLTNGCLPAIVLVDAVSRFIPGVIGHSSAAAEDSFEAGLLDCPHYTRPEVFEGQQVPQVLLEGHHAETAQWRHRQALQKTKRVRPDLYVRHVARQVDELTGGSDSVSGPMISQITLSVADLQRSRRFFKDSLGLKPLESDAEGLRYRLGNTELLLIPMGAAGAVEPSATVECLVSDPKLWQRIVKSGSDHIDGDGNVRLTDPDGYLWVLRGSEQKTKRQQISRNDTIHGAE